MPRKKAVKEEKKKESGKVSETKEVSIEEKTAELKTEEKKKTSKKKSEKESGMSTAEIDEKGIKDPEKQREKKERVKKIKLNEKPEWLSQSKEEIEDLIVKMAKEGISPQKIGLALRDSHGIPSVKIMGKKIGRILSAHNIKTENDLNDLIKKAEKLKKHIEKNKQDKVAKRNLQITLARIIKVSNYQKNKGLLPKDWQYEKNH